MTHALCRQPERPIVEEAAGEEGGAAESRAAPGPVRGPLVLGALTVFAQASTISEIRLGVPALSIRLGLQARLRPL